MKETFSDKLKKAMKLQNVTATTLSKICGISKQSISQYINGIYEAKPKNLHKLAKALNVNPRWLISEITENNESTYLIEETESINVKIARKIRYYRKENNISQKELAKLVGVKTSSVSNWETGDNSLKIETLIKLCSIFHVDLNEMCELQQSRNILSKKEEKLIKSYRKNIELQPAIDKLLLTKKTPLTE